MPAAIPMIMTKKTKPTSRVSFTAFRNRTIDNAPTSENARARFDPMMSITTETTMERITRVCTKLWLYETPLWVDRYV